MDEMQLKELRETLTDARLLIPAEMASMDYKLRDRRRFDHLISIARWAQQENAMVTLDADINPGLLYATLLLELDFDPAAFPDLFDILEAIDRRTDFEPLPINGGDPKKYIEELQLLLTNAVADRPWRSGGEKDFFVEPFLIAPPPPVPEES